MGHVRTSTSFYRRGVPNNYVFFGQAVQGNYPIVQPQYFFNFNTVSTAIKIPRVYSLNKN